MNNTQISKLSSYLKVSCSALLLSGSLVGYGFTKDAFAQTQDEVTETSNETTTVQSKLASAISKAKSEINHLKHLDRAEIKSYKDDLEDAKDQTEIDEILKDAREESIVTAEEKSVARSTETSSTDEYHAPKNDSSKDSTSIELDKIMNDLDALSKKVDSSQQNTTTETSKETSTQQQPKEDTNSVEQDKAETPSTEENHGADKHHTSILDDLNKVKNDVNMYKDKGSQSTQANNTEEQMTHQTRPSTEETTTEEPATEETKDNKEAKQGLLSGIEDMGKNNNQYHRDQSVATDSTINKHFDALKDKLSDKEKIDQTISKIERQHEDTTKRYTDRKLEQLRQLRSQVNQNQDLSVQQRQNIEKDIASVRNKVKDNRNLILEQLNNTSDKQEAVKQIIGSVFSKNETQDILKHINTIGKSDKQITDQIMQQLDGLTSASSDDILKSMFDQAPNKEQLIKTLLSTRLGNHEASSIAKRLMNEDLSNSELVERLKQELKAQASNTADDILRDVLDKTTNQKQAIETILATKLNQAKAHALADVISKIQTSKADTLDLIKSALNGKANDLLQLQNQLNQSKNKLDYILAPIKNRPTLLDRINGNTHSGNGLDLFNSDSSLLGGLLGNLNSGGSLLDGIDDIPNPVQGLSLGDLNNGGGLLSGLFDEEGNFSLPATGETLKKSWLPITVVLAIAGGLFVWLGRRKRHHPDN
ncbi:hypothetical protein MT340_001325 [Staphylococcus sp. NRL 16/872]|uniref:LPXTG cell wall anchor domain-containing protein n=1 Tax=Staphylococcus sp. NRL 16/872 TaxID=2930131 RepID=UPI001FB1CC9C|nr:LPXTG cell wall anchor domain-containing protein [Staphylococcus sp. NRL 16/872]MCJ1655413.1 hypothetical protein [Staphylococcus sp. NRL 21/187]MCJ1667138.1 hypothetical protein [Staphylococcus sp. NRL 19/737]WEN69619.1 hypothetical protein MT340_001325 [Staphylococcus sp. NRL 16/872]